MFSMTRREFLRMTAITGGSLLLGCKKLPQLNELDAFIENQMSTVHIPGLAACIVRENQIVWSNGYGWANIGIPPAPRMISSAR